MGRIGGARASLVATLLGAGLLTACTSSAAGAGSGPCFDEAPHAPDATPTVACEDARYELVAEDTLGESGLAGWPGRIELATLVHDRCLEVAEEYVGAPLTELGLDVWFHHPDEAAWADGAREIVCAVEDIEGQARGDDEDAA